MNAAAAVNDDAGDGSSPGDGAAPGGRARSRTAGCRTPPCVNSWSLWPCWSSEASWPGTPSPR
ncbi:hypothetical protein GXW82_01310 [Streptacidiphilus sp. 4-A2]|nr:hypothetical protein [Streptacidiphilus sp. 4-A2]